MDEIPTPLVKDKMAAVLTKYYNADDLDALFDKALSGPRPFATYIC
uniref:Uncharacterized protein n=1 Tax=Peronospora matthiolae TaxID=2874970 RepID=A0AAV1T9W3_9STRA